MPRDAVVATARRRGPGREEIRQFYAGLLAHFPEATWELRTTVFEGDLLYVEWGIAGGGNRVDDEVDTFVFDDGLFRLQTAHLTVRAVGS
jgi:predicted SnoaL-like aldol condensation-catalyzing enzyme